MLYEKATEAFKKKISYFHCGEYGKRLSRPHYHALIFGYYFPDRVLWKSKPFPIYTSKELESLWPFGFSTVGHLTPASAAYVARYTLKKVYGKKAAAHYGSKHPEYVTMSRNPGIGKTWYHRFKTDIYPDGVYVSEGGVKQSPPKYYDYLYNLENPREMQKIKLARKKRADHNKLETYVMGRTYLVSNNDGIRLPVRERVKEAQINQLKRPLEDQ